jgi:hypothetical protein
VIFQREASRRSARARAGLAACAIAFVAGVGAPSAHASVSADSAGVYSEELERGNSADGPAVARAQRDAAIGLVRQPFSWSRIEIAPGRADFSVYDDVMAAAAGAGLSVLPVLMDPPAWRSTAPATGRVRAMYPPRDPAEMAALATELVRRYGPGGSFWAAHPELTPVPIHSWQVWNEPNIRAFWATGPDPQAYVRLLDAVGSAIRAADPRAEIVAAGLPLADSGIPIFDFVKGMYAAGARGTFDTVAIHPYASDAQGVLQILWAVRAQLDRLGDPDRPIWATEFGWATGGPPVTITMSEASQAAVLSDTIGLMQRSRAALRLRGFVAFRWRDVALNPGQTDVWALHTGLLRGDDAVKPALGALGDAIARWRREPAPERAITSEAALEQASPEGAAGAQAAPVVGVRRRVLRIRRFVIRGRLHVLVDVRPGGGADRVRIAYEAIRGGRVAFRQTRRVGSRARVARVVFKLSPGARSAQRLRITASQGASRVTRMLHMHARRRTAAPARR